MTFADTRHTAPVRGLPDYEFDQTKFWVRDGVRTVHGWVNTRTGDSGTHFATKAAAVADARRFEKGLRAEERGEVYMEQFAGAPADWLHAEATRLEAVLADDPFTASEERCYRAGLLTGTYRLLANLEGNES